MTALAQRIHTAEYIALLEEKEKRACKRSLFQFVRSSFHLLEPGRKYLHNWHIEAMAEHLEAINRRQIRRLVINLPFRGMKSLVCGVAWPVWTWIQDEQPDTWLGSKTRFLTLSYASNLAIRDAVKSRYLMQTPWFQERWGEKVKFRADQNEKSYYENEWLGYRLAMGFDSSATGRDGDIQIVDDPHDAIKAMYSDTERQSAIEAWDQKLASRLTDLDKGAQVIVMQRLHPNDLSGHVLAQGGWEHLNLPLEYSPSKRVVTSIGWKDPRSKDKENMWPERYTPDVVAEAKTRLGKNGWLAQMQQEPVPMGGTLLNLEWFKRFTIDPLAMVKARKFRRVIQFWDTAQKDKEINDPWVGSTWGEDHEGHYWLLDVFRDRMDYPTGKRVVANYFAKWKPQGCTAVIIEDKSTGSSLLQELPQARPAIPVVGMLPEKDKLTRMSVESPAIEAGLVHIPQTATWLHDWEMEISLFPASETKDQVDNLSMALRYFRENSTKLLAGFVGAAEAGRRASPYAGLGR